MVLTLAMVQLLLGSHLRHLPGDWSPNAFRGIAVAHLVVAAVKETDSIEENDL